jgi:DNA-binding TFAR19-related protein (PDSD5 family)
MPQPVAERVKYLRDEIAEIRKADVQYLQNTASHSESRQASQNVAKEAEHQRRLQRLLEIVAELKSLTDWKEL